MKKENTTIKNKENLEQQQSQTKEEKSDNKKVDKDNSSKSEGNNENKDIKEESQEKESEKSLTKEESLQQEVDQQKDKYLRLFAEFENYKRRTSKERLELFKTASQELMQALLPVLDDFDRALKEINKSKDKNLIDGVELINNKFRETLKSKGLEPMTVKEGDKFDGDIHEAVTQIPAPDKSMKGKIVDVVEKGYTLGDKIIRFPKVVTGK
ncbi:nucleotide exchange factor GrpE [Flavobacteriaceae bacterium 14752]|uniref:nucleotide exchange factor GrpE n=1 Tax=Mesohalobacter salilacus TaxID=2491711 RepID=UPI000F63E2B4|nr:nucleotide exchange factor GrpE [Flavobacteriaceae bacterium 14752]